MAILPVLYRQTKLAVSTDKLLILDRNPPRPEQSQDAYILKLPDELLDKILSFASESEDHWPHRCLVPMQEGARVLTLVCQRFYQISLPLLYRSIDASKTHFVPPSKAVRALHRTLRNRPSLGPLCQILHIHVPDISWKRWSNPQLWKTAYDIISWLPNVRQFSIHGGFERWPVVQWDFISRVGQCMPNIEKLDLSRESWNLHLAQLLEFVRFPRLASLVIRGASKDQQNTTEPKLLEVCRLSSLIRLLTYKCSSKLPSD